MIKSERAVWLFAGVCAVVLLLWGVALMERYGTQPGETAGAVNFPSASTTAAPLQVAPAEVQDAAQDAAPAAPPDVAPAPEGDTRKEVSAVLFRWTAAMAHNDVPLICSFYADHLDRYFLQRNVSLAVVRRDKQTLLLPGHQLHGFRISEMVFDELTSDDATVSLVKSWVVLDQAHDTLLERSTRSRIWLVRTDLGWKIRGEQDLR